MKKILLASISIRCNPFYSRAKLINLILKFHTRARKVIRPSLIKAAVVLSKSLVDRAVRSLR